MDGEKMKERPVLFKAEMVQAILSGRKTQTRRVVKPQPKGAWAAPGRTACPYGIPGDRLWLRETWGTFAGHDHVKPSDFEPHGVGIWYRADDIKINYHIERWRPSIHMPRWASRITLEVTNVRVERLQRISIDDILAEGVDFETGKFGEWFEEAEHLHIASYSAPSGELGTYMRLWDSIYGKSDYTWNANPWVWVVEFKTVTQ